MRVLLVGMMAGVCALGQGFQEPPGLIRIHRIPVESGEAVRAASRYQASQAPVNVVGGTAVSGLAEHWLMEAHDSFSSIEAVDRAVGGIPRGGMVGADDVIPAGNTWVALYRPFWSYRPEEAARGIAKARYLFISVYRARPGSEYDFASLAQQRRAYFDMVNLDRPDIAYQVISGAPWGTYVVVTPLATLSVLDSGVVRAHRGVERGPRTPTKSDIGREDMLFRVAPEFSWVSDDFAAAELGFWRGKSR